MFASPFPVRFLASLSLGLFFLFSAQAQTFKNPPLLPTSTDVTSIVKADVNQDGKLDLLYLDGVSGQEALHVLLGKGDGTFTHGVDISLPSGICCSLTIADVTNDGKLDVILSGISSSTPIVTFPVAVLVGNGDGTFQPPLVSTLQAGNISISALFRSAFAVGDINGDGNPDLALLDSANELIFLLLGDGKGNFTLSGTLVSATRDAVYLADLNGDHHLDLVTTDSIGALFEVYLGKGDGTFPTFTRYSVGNAAGTFFFVDINGDGHPDMVTTFFPGLLGYFPGNADGTFGPLVTLGPSPSSFPLSSVGDLNGDGIPDLTYVTPSGLGVCLGKNGLAFGPLLTTISGGSTSPYSPFFRPSPPVTGDFNTDGHIDLAMPVEGGIVLLFGKGDGTFASADFYDLGQEVGATAVAKFSGTAFEDIAVTLPATFPRLLLGNGTGKFTLGPDPNPSYGSPGALVTVLAADFNGDGKPDLNLGNMVPNTTSSGTQSVSINLGTGNFTTPASVSNSSPIMADFNRDGRTDIIQVANGQISVSLGQADGSFQLITTALRDPFGTGLFNVGDVNKDGKPDLILNFYDHLEIWFGNGDGTFTFSNSINIQGVVNDVVAVVADIDGDGNADLILAPDYNPGGRMGPLAIFYGNGDGTFQSPVYVPISRRYSQVTAVDVNRDNKPDLVMTDGAAIAVMLNLGGRKFDSEVDYIAGRSVSALSVVDVNGDGFPDIVVANTGGTTVTVLLNQPNGSSPGGAVINGSLSIAPEPSVAGQPFTITLSLMGQSTGAPVPTGSVSFSVDGAFIADVALTNGSVSYTYSATLIPIQHAITASYNGDSNYAPKSFSVSHTVQPPTYSTQTIFAATPPTLLASHTLHLSATVTSAVSLPAGVVTFMDGGNALGSASIDAAGVAYFDTALLAPGVHSLSAIYDGYTQYGFDVTTPYVAAIFSPSSSGVSLVTVTANVTVISLVPSATSATAGTVVTFKAQATSSAGVPFGGVSFFDGNTLLGTLSLDSNASTSFSTASLAAGSHTITATFNANGPYAGSTSSPTAITITPAPVAATFALVALSWQPGPVAGSSSLVATVSSANPPPSGSVTFLDSGMILGTAPVDSMGVARLANVQMSSGTHTLTGSFGGTSQYAPSVSPVLKEQWPSAGPGFSLLVSAGQFPPAPPVESILQVDVEALGGFRQSVGLSCSAGLPENYTCEFSPVILNGSGNASLLILPASKAARVHRFSPSWPGITSAFVFALLMGSATRRRSRVLFAFLGIYFLNVLSGCASTKAPAAVSQTVVLTIQASVPNGSQTIIHSAQYSLRLPKGN